MSQIQIKDGMNVSTGVVVHKGEFVKYIIRQLGVKITSVAAALDLSRNTLYNKFTDPDLSTEFIYRIGQIIKYDFSKRLSDVQPITYFAEEPTIVYARRPETVRTEQKYVELMEKYNHVLKLLTRVVLTKADESVLKEVNDFLQKNMH